MTHIWMSHNTHRNESWLTNEWVKTHMNEPHHTCECVTSHLWRSYVRYIHESCYTCIWATSHMWIRHVTHVHMSHVTHVHATRPTCVWVLRDIWMRHVTHVYESRDTSEQLELHVSMCHTYESGTSNKQISRVTLPGISRERDPCWNRKQTYAETWKRDLEKRPRK